MMKKPQRIELDVDSGQAGQGLAEYVIVVVVVALVVLAGVRYFAGGINDSVEEASEKLKTLETDPSAAPRDSNSSAQGEAEQDAEIAAKDRGVIEDESDQNSGNTPTTAVETPGTAATDSQDLGALADARSFGVGDAELEPVPIKIDIGTLVILLLLAIALGLYLVFRVGKKFRKKNKKAKKSTGNTQ